MANQIKQSSHGLALQVTNPARSAGLVEENSEGHATYLAKVRVYSFDNLLLVVDIDKVSAEEIAELVASAARDTKSVHRAMDASVQIAGNGYQVQLPPATDAGLREGDRAACRVARGILIISRDDGTSVSTNAARLAEDLLTTRRTQLE